MGKPKKIELIDISQLESWLSSTGYLFPSNEIELERFNKLFNDYNFLLDDKSIDPIAIINNTFHREPRIISIFENDSSNSEDVNNEIESLKMVARKAKAGSLKNAINKMLKNHDSKKSDE